jgi:hypothetical protein
MEKTPEERALALVKQAVAENAGFGGFDSELGHLNEELRAIAEAAKTEQKWRVRYVAWATFVGDLDPNMTREAAERLVKLGYAVPTQVKFTIVPGDAPLVDESITDARAQLRTALNERDEARLEVQKLRREIGLARTANCDVEPTRDTLQTDHVCCKCGAGIYISARQEDSAVCAVVPIRLPGKVSTAIRIAWCDRCWIRQCGTSDRASAVCDMRLDGLTAENRVQQPGERPASQVAADGGARCSGPLHASREPRPVLSRWGLWNVKTGEWVKVSDYRRTGFREHRICFSTEMEARERALEDQEPRGLPTNEPKGQPLCPKCSFAYGEPHGANCPQAEIDDNGLGDDEDDA